MPCYSPLQAFYDSDGSVKFSNIAAELFQNGVNISKSDIDYFSLPCGRCIGCRLEHSRQWAMRCMHEASLYDDNCFITLTYDDDHLPKGGTLVKKHFQDFMKRFRKKFSDRVIRYYHCGEYGEDFSRPHYHACIFGFDFSDKVLFNVVNDNKIYTSDVLSSLWTDGFCTIGALTFESAAYVARYCTKKITGAASVEHYQGRQPEYATMSRRPGIGRGWYDKFKTDVFPSDYLIVDGVKVKPPRYYDSIFKECEPFVFEEVRSKRLVGSSRNEKDQTYRRLKDRELCKKLQVSNLKRSLEI